jgi:RNA polymerase sigma factor (sigma-70 family)
VLSKPLRALVARARPPREEVEPAALELIARYGADIMSTARRYSQTREDAEDAYQRGLEILLTKAPSTSPDQLVPWLKTVVKHEAWALRKQRERGGVPAEPREGQAGPADTHEQVERLEKLQRGAEALGRLKPQEIRCMLLLAEGHSYKQIQEITGYSYTKVNRCLSEGRRSFLARVERIESGAECERLAPLLSALADGEASSRDVAALRPHLRTCLSCRAALRDARDVPARVAALAPVGLLLGGGGGGGGGALRGALRAASDWLGERVTWVAVRGQELFETAASHKLAAAAASAAALGGGGIATVQVGGDHPPARDREPRAVVAERRDARVPAPAPRWRPAAAAVAVPSAGAPERAAEPRKRVEPKRGRRQPAQPPAPAPPVPVVEPAERLPPVEPERESPPPDGETGEFGP